MEMSGDTVYANEDYAEKNKQEEVIYETPDWKIQRDAVAPQPDILNSSRKRPFLAAAVCLGLLYVLMLAGIIGLFVSNSQTQASLETSIQDLKAKVLRTNNTATQQVVFSAGFGGAGTYGPFNTMTTLVYKNVFINIGNAYSQTTGIFTAPVHGVYHFTIYHHYLDNNICQASITKNGMNISSIAGKSYGMASNGVIVQLEVGDQVSVRLWAGAWLYDYASHFSNFNGFLLFTQ